MKQRLAATLCSAVIITAPVFATEPASQQRLDSIAQRGAKIMPFNLEQTLHIFSETATGGYNRL